MWLTTIIDHPVRQLTYNVIFPKERLCRMAHLDDGECHRIVPIVKGSNGHTLVHFHQTLPQAHGPYTLSWNW